MAIRIREVDGRTVALCAVESDPKPGDVYLDDAQHYALAAKFAADWRSIAARTAGLPEYPDEWIVMASQKVRDAETEITAWTSRQITRGLEDDG